MKKVYFLLLFLILLGICIRIPLFNQEEFINPDGIAYARLGQNLIERSEYSFRENHNWGIIFPPGYPLFIGLTNLVVNDLFIAGKIVSLLASILTIVIFYFLGKELHNENVGVFAATAFTMYPFIIRTATQVLTESLFFLFFFLSLYLFFRLYKTRTKLLLVLFSITVAGTYLIRPEGVFLLVLPILFLRSQEKTKNGMKRWNILPDINNLLRVVFILVIVILIAFPYISFITESTGHITISGKSGMNVLVGEVVTGGDYEKIVYSLNEEKNQIDIFEKNNNVSLLGYIGDNPTEFRQRFFNNILNEIKWIFLLAIPIIIPLLFSFLNKGFLKDTQNKIIITLIILFVLIYACFFINFARFMLPIILLLLLLSLTGFVHSTKIITQKITLHRIKRNMFVRFIEKNSKRIIVLFLIVSSIPYIVYYGFMYEHDLTEYVDAASFLKEKYPEYEQINVMSRRPEISFYSEAKYTNLPYANYKDIIHFGKLYNVDFIVIDEGNLEKWDNYEELTQMDKLSDDVTLVYDDSSKTYRIQIFEMNNREDGITLYNQFFNEKVVFPVSS
ncbi:hypothetical protein COV17_03530 [Candidatus Woesearchaeota archaeon CG10_big_fil_rev_8_21_14_0_10_36_11]|nr:MAG: hypothetical protein COV17_03530 [Candidatus Woesearchaeota archaeon CG10_big_fil_rev_8_21_14_0_10_36_11]